MKFKMLIQVRNCSILLVFLFFVSGILAQVIQIPGKVGNKIFLVSSPNIKLNWLESLFRCTVQTEFETPKLATIESAEENEFLKNYYQGIYGDEMNGPELWTAGSTLGSENHWESSSLKWATSGNSISFSFWGGGSQASIPSRPLSTKSGLTKCVSVSYSHLPFAPIPSFSFYWYIEDCTLPKGFLCQAIEP